MRSQVAVVSIPGSGTTFTNDLVYQAFPDRQSWHLTDAGIVDAFQWNGLMVIPVRPAKKVAWTWEKQGRHPHFNWFAMWRILLELPGHFFFIEEDRERELALLSDYLGASLTTDWAPVNSVGDEGECEFDAGMACRIYDELLSRRYGDGTEHH